jgi:hypothetical protein
MMRVALVVLLCMQTYLVSSSTTANAEGGDVGDLLKAYDSKDRLRKEYATIHADLIARGIFAANTEVVYVRKQAPLYCQPLALQLTGEQVIDLLRRAAEKEASLGTLSTGTGILIALQRTFPCKQ